MIGFLLAASLLHAVLGSALSLRSPPVDFNSSSIDAVFDLNTSDTILTDSQRVPLQPITWRQFQLSGFYLPDAGHDYDTGFLESLHRYYARRPPSEAVDLSTPIFYKKVDRQRTELHARWALSTSNPPTNGIVAGMLSQVISAVNGGQWSASRGTSASFVIQYNDQLAFYVRNTVTQGQNYAFNAVGYDWHGSEYPDKPIPFDIATRSILDKLCTAIAQQFYHPRGQGNNFPIAQGSTLTINHEGIEASFTMLTNQAYWPEMDWTDFEDAIEFLEDQYEGREAYCDTWLQIGFNAQMDHSTPIGVLTIIDKSGLTLEEGLNLASVASANLTNVQEVS